MLKSVYTTAKKMKTLHCSQNPSLKTQRNQPGGGCCDRLHVNIAIPFHVSLRDRHGRETLRWAITGCAAGKGFVELDVERKYQTTSTSADFGFFLRFRLATLAATRTFRKRLYVGIRRLSFRETAVSHGGVVPLIFDIG